MGPFRGFEGSGDKARPTAAAAALGRVQMTNRGTQGGPQWIVAQGPLSHLQFLGATKSSAKDLPLPGLEIASDSSSL
jgi:hypothetical protein